MRLRDRMERRALEALAGRRAELERLEAFALGHEPLVMSRALFFVLRFAAPIQEA
jgi:hypothetical protein